MACTGSNQTESSYHARIAQSSLLGLLLIFDIAGNAYLLMKLWPQPRKWSPSRRIVKTLAVVGILNGLVNIAVHTVKLIAGQWMLGNVVCQFHGVLGSVILHGWTWLMTLAVFERFVKLLLPGEHNSFFSAVNLRIMIWGLFLLLTVMFLGPVYGWGEYSQFRGKIDMVLRMTNSSHRPTPQQMSSTPDPFAHLKPDSIEDKAIVYYEFLMGREAIPTSVETMQNLSNYLSHELNVSIRKPLRTATGVEIPMRAANERTLSCLWRDYRLGKLDRDVTRIVAHEHILGFLGLNIHGSILEINSSALAEYESIYIPFQEMSMCALDFSHVNHNVTSFILFTYISNLFLPFILIAYFALRLVRAGYADMCQYSVDGLTPDDAKWTRLILFAAFGTIVCHAPYLATNLALGSGVYIHIAVYCLAHMLLYASTGVLSFLGIFTMRNALSYDHTELELACCGFLYTVGERTNIMSDLHQRLLARSTPKHTATPGASQRKRHAETQF